MLKTYSFILLITFFKINPARVVNLSSRIGFKQRLEQGYFDMKEKLCGIYKITSPSKKIYIGQSNDIDKRFYQYKNNYCTIKQRRLFNSFQKHGIDKHKFEIIHLCDKEDLNKLEKYYVDLYGTFNSVYGLNLRDGGGCVGKLSKETREKMSKSRMGHVGYMLGKKRTLEARQKTSASLKNSYQTNPRKPMSEETKIKISETLKRKGIKPLSRFDCSGKRMAKRSKKIVNTETGEIFIGVKGVLDRFPICTYQKLNKMLRGYTVNKTPFKYI